MDILYFLMERTRLIHQYYEQAAQPSSDIIRKIETEEEPFILPCGCHKASTYRATS